MHVVILCDSYGVINNDFQAAHPVNIKTLPQRGRAVCYESESYRRFFFLLHLIFSKTILKLEGSQSGGLRLGLYIYKTSGGSQV